MVPKLFGPIRERYLSRPGGYTRILRIEPVKEDQAESAILELVDSPKDMRFAMTAKTLSRLPEDKQMNEITAKNVKKVTQFREHGIEQLQSMVQDMRLKNKDGWDDRTLLPPKRVYLLEAKDRRTMRYPEEVDDWALPNKFEREPGLEVPVGTRMWELQETLDAKKQEKIGAERLRAEDEAKAERVLAEARQSR